MEYQVDGSLRGDDPTYVVRQADAQIYAGLKAGKFCYVFNCRQMGKSSLLKRTKYCLETEGYRCIYLDMTRLSSGKTTPMQWYKGIILSLFYELNLGEQVNFKNWWVQQTKLSPVERLHQFVEQLLLPVIQSERIFIFIDEINSLLSLSFPVSDFFAWIRHCYNRRTDNPDLNRLGFALFGIVSPSDLMADERQTPFNIGQPIDLYGFQMDEATPLLKGIEAKFKQPAVILREIIRWTGGQPFLTQKLCQLVLLVCAECSIEIINIPDGAESFWVEQLVKSRVIQHWESLDEPEHFRSIRDRLLFDEQRAGRLLGLYQQVLQAESPESGEQPQDLVIVDNNREQKLAARGEPARNLIPIDDSQDVIELLLSGLVEKRNGYLRVKNLIYLHIFDLQWVVRQLDNLRPYSQTFNAWVGSNCKDESCLLRGQALKDAQNWAQGKSLSNLDYKFLAASRGLELWETSQGLKPKQLRETEVRLPSERINVRLQKRLLAIVTLALIVFLMLAVVTLFAYRNLF